MNVLQDLLVQTAVKVGPAVYKILNMSVNFEALG